MAQKRVDSRIQWVDMAKGWGILFVIYSHLCTGFLPSRWMFTFHIPLFFFLSGYVFSIGRPFPEFLKRKARTLLLPYFALAIPTILFEGFYVHPYGVSPWHWIWQLILNTLIQRRQWTLWYLACLFCLNILFYGIVKLSGSFRRTGIICLILAAVGYVYVILGGPVLPWNLDACLTALPFFFAGYGTRMQYAAIREKISGRKSVGLFCLLGAVNLLAGFGSIFGGRIGLNIFENTYGFLPLTLISAFAGIGCVVIVSHWFTCQPVVYLGRNSLLYFAWHQSPMMHFLFLFWQKTGITVGDFSTPVILLIRFAELLAILAVLTPINELISRSRLKCVLGK